MKPVWRRTVNFTLASYVVKCSFCALGYDSVLHFGQSCHERKEKVLADWVGMVSLTLWNATPDFSDCRVVSCASAVLRNILPNLRTATACTVQSGPVPRDAVCQGA